MEWTLSFLALFPVSAVVTLLVIKGWPPLMRAIRRAGADARPSRREETPEERASRMETDRRVYLRRLSILIHGPLATYIRSGQWTSDQRDLDRLLAELENGTREHFLDAEVDELWQALGDVSILLGRRRSAEKITDLDIHYYDAIRQEWEDAAARSFGPLPETPEPVPPRRDTDRAAYWTHPATGRATGTHG